MKTALKVSVSTLVLVLIFPLISSAHVVVTPAEAPAASYKTFNMSVPSERQSATISMRLLVPAGLTSVRPSVKPGWNVNVKKEMQGTITVVTEIVWTGGSIPAEMRDDFTFSAKTPESGPLVWKAYQTYADGKLVTWDAAPVAGGHNHESVEGPYSQTVITPAVSHDDHGVHGAMGDEHANPVHALYGMIPTIAALAFALIALIEVNKMKK